MVMNKIRKNNRFVIDLGDLELDDATRTKISADMCCVATKYIFTHGDHTDGVFHPFWKNGGGWIPHLKDDVLKKIRDFDERVVKELGKNRFVVDLGDYKISDELSNKIEMEMNSVVISRLGEMKIPVKNFALYVPDIFAGGIGGEIGRLQDSFSNRIRDTASSIEAFDY